MYYISTMIDEPRGEGQMVIIKADNAFEARQRLNREAIQNSWFIVPDDVASIDADDEALEDIRADSELWRRLQHSNIITWSS